MDDVTVFAAVLACTVAAALTWGTVCYLAGRPAEIAANWREGVVWLRERRVLAAVVRARLIRLPRAVVLLLLAVAVRSHGRHRAGAGA